MKNNGNLAKLKSTFPKLTEANQQYVLGLAEGLKQAQGDKIADGAKEEKPDLGERGEDR